jgi:hypothetical protein
MPTPSSPNRISFTDIVNEFGLPVGKNLGAYRISQNVGTLTNLPLDEGIPQSVSIGSSTIKFSDFHNKRLNVVIDYTNFFPIVTILPNIVLTATNLNANINNLNEGVSNFNNIYATNTALNLNTLLRLGFPTPSNALTLGNNLQTFRARVRKNADGGNATTVRIEVRENNILRANSSNFTITSTIGENISFTWNASILSSLSGQDVEIVIAQQSGGVSTTVASRRWIEVDTADWIADLSILTGGLNARQIYNDGIYNVVIGGLQNNINKEYPLDPSQNYKITVNLNSRIGSSKGARTNCAFRTGNWRTSTGDALTSLKLELGESTRIYGAGGDGGSSNDGDYTNDNIANPNPNGAGQNGTSALGIDYPTTVINRGRIITGGGGGGAGGGELYRSGKSTRRSSGGGGGGGSGFPFSDGGLAAGTSSGGSNAGSVGQPGSFESEGLGGAGGTNAGRGGDGGLYVDGNAGDNSLDQLGGAGGLAGYAVVIASSAAPLTPPIQNLVDGVVIGNNIIDTPT